MKLQVGKRYKGEFGYCMESLKIKSIYRRNGETFVEWGWGYFFPFLYLRTDTLDRFKERIGAGKDEYLCSIEI